MDANNLEERARIVYFSHGGGPLPILGDASHKSMDHKNNFPYRFNSNACKTCDGKCCRGFGGYVWVGMEEIEKMADTMKLDLALFAKQYVRQVLGRYSLQERVINGERFCCFFDWIDCQCTIYPGRPSQCRTFPFWNRFKKEPQGLFLECPGVEQIS